MPGVIDQLEIRRFLAFGTGVGIEMRASDLEVVIARVRPNGIAVLGRTTIRGFRERPAAQWGKEYADFLKSHGSSGLGATVLLARQDVIVRQVPVAGVAAGDLEAAIALQIDTLHPYGEDDVQYGWTRLGKESVLIGLLRRSTMDAYAARFGEAGIAVASFTFSAGAIHAAARLLGPPAAQGFVAVNGMGETPVEIYGESPDRPLFSAEFDLPLERVVGLAVAELRLDPSTEPVPLERILPAPRVNPIENDLSRDALPYATALAAACPRLAPAANLLPVEMRSSRSRALLAPSVVLGVLVLLLAGALMAYSKIEDRRYLDKLEAQITREQGRAMRAQSLDRQTDAARARTRLLDDFRLRSKADLEALNELTKMLVPPVWTTQVDLTRDNATIAGEAAQAAPLLGLIDGSSLFHNSEFSLIAPSPAGEVFRIRTLRGKRK